MRQLNMTSSFCPILSRHIIGSGILTVVIIVIGALNSGAQEVGKIEVVTNMSSLVAF